MKVKYKIMLVMLFGLIIFSPFVSSELKPFKTYVNVSVVGYGEGNETAFNLTIANEDSPIEIKNINKNSNTSNQYLIILIQVLI